MGRWLWCAAALLALGVARVALGVSIKPGSGSSSSSLRRTRALSQEEELEQILGDGQPEDIGYGFQRTRSTRPSYQGLLLLDKAAQGWQDASSEAPSTFRERLEAKRAPDDDDVPVLASSFRERVSSSGSGSGQQRRQRGRQQQHLLGLMGGARRQDIPAPDMMMDLSERDLEALRELWARYQMRTGAIDVGPDDLTDLEALQILEALDGGSGNDRLSVRKRSPRSSNSWDWDWYNSSPLAWSGYQLRKRSIPNSEAYEDADGSWSDEPAEVVGVSEDVDPTGESALAARARLAMLISPQLFDERYNDPSVKRLLLTKRSLPHAMKRRKKSAPSSAQPPANDPTVQRDLAHIFGEPEPPRALPLAAATITGTTPSSASPAPPSPASNGTKTIGHDQHGAMNPIGMAHETDKLAREHQQSKEVQHEQHEQHEHGTTAKPDPKHEHVPPMVAAEGPHNHDQTQHKELGDKEGSAEPKEEPRALEVRQPGLRIVKKSIDWSSYFGMDRRRKKSTGPEDMETNQINDDWLLRETLRAYAKASKPSNINKRVAVKKEGASPDALLLGSWGSGSSDDDYLGWEAGRCGAVTRLTEDCRLAVGTNDALLPLCVLYQACRLCGGAVGVPSGRSCDAELAHQGAALCSGAGDQDSATCLATLENIVEVRRSRYGGDTDICARQPCLARFFLASPAVAYSR